MNGPQLPFWASWGKPTPASFDAQSWGTYPPGWRLFRYAILLKTLHFLKPVLHSSSYLRSVENSMAHWLNTVVFLPQALRLGTRTLFSFQGTTRIIAYLTNGMDKKRKATPIRLPDEDIKAILLIRLHHGLASDNQAIILAIDNTANGIEQKEGKG
jgi:hypothetical protein